MPKLPLSQTVDASRCESSWRSSALSLATSTVIQGLAITTLIVTPLLVAQSMPEPVSHLTMPQFIPARMEPPLARGPEQQPDATPPGQNDEPPINLDVFVPPTKIPDGIPEAEAYFPQSDPTGVEAGLPPSLSGRPLPTNPEPAPESEPEPILIIGTMRPPQKVTHVDRCTRRSPRRLGPREP